MKKINILVCFILFSLITNGQPELLKDIILGSSSSDITNLTALEDKLIFQQGDLFEQSSLWRSDGTEEGTVNFYTLPSIFSYVDGFFPLGNKAFFVLDDSNNGVYGRELWVSDGTESGTTIVKDIAPGTDDGILNSFEVVTIYAPDGKRLIRYYGIYNGELYFSANDGIVGEELWKSDGTESGTILVKDMGSASSNPENFVEANGVLFFSTGGLISNNLWITDGTESGTQKIFSSLFEVGNFINYQNELYFTAKTFESGIELWKSDGTESGTRLVKDINPNGNSIPFNLTVSNDLLFFTATDGTTGLELYRTDGSEEGTFRITDMNDEDTEFDAPDDLVDVDGKLFFTGRDDIFGRELWKSDGTELGTSLITEINPGTSSTIIRILEVVDDKVFFSIRQFDPDTGQELWVSNGTESGTYLVYDLAEGPQGSGPNQVTKLGAFLFFNAFDLDYGFEIRKLDCAYITTNTEEFIEPSLMKIYPNPFIDMFSIELPDNFIVGEKVQIEIFDNLGRKVSEIEKEVASPLRVNYPFLSKGVFFVKLEYRGKHFSFHLMKL